MRKLLTFLIALGAIVFAVVSPVKAGSMMLLGVGSVGSAGPAPFGITLTASPQVKLLRVRHSLSPPRE